MTGVYCPYCTWREWDRSYPMLAHIAHQHPDRIRLLPPPGRKLSVLKTLVHLIHRLTSPSIG